jgi:lipoprotein-releasing system permease protein
MEVKVGHNVFINGPSGDSRRFKITGIFESGVNVIDEKRIYAHRRAAQAVLHMPFETSFIVVKLKDPDRAPQDSEAFEELLSHRSRSWQEREQGNMQIFHALRISAGLGISCIILLAGFGIFNVLTMSVLEKTKEIAILRSMGYTRNDISAIFLWQGLLVAILGILAGWVFGAMLTYGVSHIPIKIRGILKADHFIVAWSLGHYLWAAFLASISVFIAAYIPARRAAHVDPVNILRGSSQ